MSLENYTGFIGAFVVTNPTGADPKSEGDNHLRGIKDTLVVDGLFRSRDLGTANGVASLDATGDVPASQLGNALPVTGGTLTGSLVIADSTAGALEIEVSNTGSGTALISAKTLAGDPFFAAVHEGFNLWTWGLDVSDADAWKLANGATLDVNTYARVGVGGAVAFGGAANPAPYNVAGAVALPPGTGIKAANAFKALAFVAGNTLITVFNVASITVHGAGDYTLNFTNSIGTTNCPAFVTVESTGAHIGSFSARAATSIRIHIWSTSAPIDLPFVAGIVALEA